VLIFQKGFIDPKNIINKIKTFILQQHKNGFIDQEKSHYDALLKLFE
jgi:hypothetical protein